jgi:SAM-dependent methyltransferase
MVKTPPSVWFDGMEFRIDSSLLRTPSLAKTASKIIRVLFVLASANHFNQLANILIVACLVVGAIVFIVPILHLIFGKRLSSLNAGFFIPKCMKAVDVQFGRIRVKLLKPTVRGRVLDVGAGGGAYFQYAFSSDNAVTEVVALEPNVHCHPKMQRTLEELKQGNGFGRGLELKPGRPLPKVKITAAFIEDHLKEVGPARYDFAILGNVLCEVPDQGSVLRALDELMVDGGRIFFSEHVRHANWKAKFQDFVNPWWCTLSDGCNCNRDTLGAMKKHCPDWTFVNWTFPQMPGPFEVGLALKRCNRKEKSASKGGKKDQ